MKNIIVTGMVIMLLGLLSLPAAAQVFFVAQLDGSQEGSSIVTSATGTAFAELSPDTKTLTYRITYANLDSTFTASHFHLGAPGVSGGVVEPITFHGNTADSSWAIPDSLVASLMKGNIYINIHSLKYKSGEIRGQLKLAGGIGISMSLDGTQEGLQVPGTGTGWAIFANDTAGLIYHITIAGLTSALTGSHFHYGATGQSGPVIHPITFTDSTASGTWYFPDSLSSALAFDSLYVNVHTSNHTGGEIRGQFQLQPRTLADGSRIFFTATLNSFQSVPPDTTQGTGTFWGILSIGNGTAVPPTPVPPSLTYRVTYANLSSPFKAAHFHLGSEGNNGGVEEPISFVGNTAQGIWSGIPVSDIRAMLEEQIYVNIHSTNYPNGEIRGQLRITNGIPFSISLDGSQDVPSISTGATGTGWAELDTTGSNLNYNITIAGLSSNLTGSHFHDGAAGTNGSVVEPIQFTDSTSSGIWSSIPDTLIPDLLTGSIYTNVHSTNHPGGEIRGELVEDNGFLLTAVKGASNTVPQNYELGQNYPNPFNPSTIISYNLPEKSLVNLEVFNILGEKVVTLVSESQQGGTHYVKFNGDKLASGVYFYRLNANGQNIQVRKMILLK